VLAAELGLTVADSAAAEAPSDTKDTALPTWADARAAWRLLRADGSVAGHAAAVADAAMDAPAWADPVFAVEIELPAGDVAYTPFQFTALPVHPAVERDLALLVPDGVPATTVLDAISNSAGPLLEDVVPFDVYRGTGVDPNMRSLAVRLRFRAADRTLTDADADRAVTRVLRKLEETHGIHRRG
jgi:phenylalanyl-tRNA synthetase beta chain